MHAFDRQTDRQTDVDRKTVRMLRSRTVKCMCRHITTSVFWLPAKWRGMWFWSCLSGCLYVCMYARRFKSLDVWSSYLHMRYISTVYGSSSYTKVIGSRLKSQEPKRSIILFLQCKTSIGNNSRSVKHTAVMFACSMGFSSTADRMV